MAGLKKLRQREEIDDRYKWNIAAMYGDEKEWEKDFKESEKMAEEFSAYSCLLYTSCCADVPRI